MPLAPPGRRGRVDRTGSAKFQFDQAINEASWDSFSRGSAVRRAGRAGFARNICVGLGDWESPEAVPVLTSALLDPEALVRVHAAWALGRVGSAEAREALVSRASVESDDAVRAELAAALRGGEAVEFYVELLSTGIFRRVPARRVERMR